MSRQPERQAARPRFRSSACRHAVDELLQLGSNALQGGLVTGQNPASAKGVAEKMIALLNTA